MADFSYIPQYGWRIRTLQPKTLISEYEDGKESRRQKHSTFLRIFEGDYIFNSTDADAATDFYRTKGLLIAFTIVSYDPKEVAGTEATVRFTEPLELEYAGPGRFASHIIFHEVAT